MLGIFRRKIGTERQLLRKLHLRAFPPYELDEKTVRKLWKLLPRITIGLEVALEREYPSFAEVTAHCEVCCFESPEFLMSLGELEESQPPKEPGIYGWYFDKMPPKVPCRKCISVDGWRLLYIGITQKSLYDRIISQHFKGKASGSVLRLKLGCLLGKKLKLQLKRTRGRLTFDEGEHDLNRWMAKHARVWYWVSYRAAQLEEIAILRYSPPLNADYNKTHKFYPRLKKIIKKCKAEAIDTHDGWPIK